MLIITIDQEDLEKAVKDYVVKMGITRQVSEINFTAGRGPSGVTTEIRLTSPDEVAPSGPTPRSTPTVVETAEAPAQEKAPEESSEEEAPDANTEAANDKPISDAIPANAKRLFNKPAA